MTWNATWPVGSVSVAANKTTGQQNTTYLETTLKQDHWFNQDAAKDGHHKFVKATVVGTSAAPLDASVGPDLDGAVYLKYKTGSSAVLPDVQPFFKNHSVANPLNFHVMQLCAMRACGVWDLITTNPWTITSVYSHNAVLTRDGVGEYTVTFPDALPSANYFVSVGGMRSDSAQPNVYLIKQGLTLAAIKTVNDCKIVARSINTAAANDDSIQIWFMAFGG